MPCARSGNVSKIGHISAPRDISRKDWKEPAPRVITSRVSGRWWKSSNKKREENGKILVRNRKNRFSLISLLFSPFAVVVLNEFTNTHTWSRVNLLIYSEFLSFRYRFCLHRLRFRWRQAKRSATLSIGLRPPPHSLSAIDLEVFAFESGLQLIKHISYFSMITRNMWLKHFPSMGARPARALSGHGNFPVSRLTLSCL